MKKISLIIISVLIFINLSLAQSPNRYANPNYMWTAFFEDFNGNAVDRTIWNVQSHFKRELGFLVDNPLNINVQNGNLELKMRYVPNYLDSIWKTTGWQHVYSNYTGAEISTKNLYHYGVYECRAKYAKQPGSWPAFWLIGGDGIPCPPGGYGNEIDIAELFSHSPFPRLGHVIHRYYPPDDCDKSKSDDFGKLEYLVDATEAYQTYKCIWTPSKIEYYVNGALRHTVNNSGQEWYPSLKLSVILSEQVCTPFNQIGQQLNPATPQTSYFDYVSVKQFFLAPEITLSTDVICTSGTATMDVDPAATNITWQLTPSSLFTTASGTGKVATITKASGANGEGKITYTFQMPSGETFTAEKSFWVGLFEPNGMELTFSNGAGGQGVLCTNLGSGNQFDLPDPMLYNSYYEIKLTNLAETQTIGQYYLYTGSTGSLNYSGLIPRFYLFWVRGINDCGVSDWYSTEIEYIDCSQLYLSLFPNPATGETTIELLSYGENVIDENIDWELQVFNQFQGLKEKKTKIKGKLTKINTSNWKDGIYIVNAIVDGQKISKKLLVKH